MIKLFLFRTGTNNLSSMIPGILIVTFITTLVIYFVLDYVLKNVMLYLVSGGILGSLYELSNHKIGITLSFIIWALILVSFIALLFQVRNEIARYFLVVLIGALLYIIDALVAGIPYDALGTGNVLLISNIVIGLLILSKSLILSWIIYTGIIKIRSRSL